MYRDEDAVLLVGSMDGSVTILDAESGICLASDRPHSKYCVRAIWSRDGQGVVVSCAWSNTLAIHAYSGEAQLTRIELRITLVELCTTTCSKYKCTLQSYSSRRTCAVA